MSMHDDEVLNAVRQTLSGVQMDRPVEEIEHRGRTRRRHRRLLGAAAAGGLAVVVALALALPSAGWRPGGGPATGGTGGSATAMQPVAFTVTRQSDSSVKLTLNLRQLFDPVALQQALAEAGVPAVVRAGVQCTPQTAELPEAGDVYRFERVTEPDGVSSRFSMVITASKMPQGRLLYFSVVTTGDDATHTKAGKVGVFLVSGEDPMHCRPGG